MVVDAHSKWPEVFELTQTTTAKTIAVLRHLFAKYGLPEQIVSDNGPQFVSKEFEEFVKGNGIKHTRYSPYHPSSNGAVERFIRTFKQAMKAGEKDGLSPQHRLENFLLSYRTTPHTTTGTNPCNLFMGRSIRTRLDLIRPDIAQQVCEKQATQKHYHDKHTQGREFVVGQRVMVKNFRPGPTYVAGTITNIVGPLTYTICVDSGQLWKRHIDHIKPLGSKLVQDEFTRIDINTGFDNCEFANFPTQVEQPNTETPTAELRYPQRNHQPP